MSFMVSKALPDAQPPPTTSPTADTATPAVAQPQADSAATPAGSLTTLKPATARALQPTFDALDKVNARFEAKAGLKSEGKPADHYARVQRADQIFKGLASKPAEQKAYVKEMAKAGEAFGINCGLYDPDAAGRSVAVNAEPSGKLGDAAKVFQSELVGVFGNQQKAQAKNQATPETNADEPAPPAQTTPVSADSAPANAPDAAEVKHGIKQLFAACHLPDSGVIKATDIDRLVDSIPKAERVAIAQKLVPYRQALAGSTQGMTVDELTAAMMKRPSAPEAESVPPTPGGPQDALPTTQPTD
jgi:hypothetical protein